MTPDAVRIVREFLGRDLTDTADMLHPDVVWFGTRGGLDQDQVLRGPDAALAYMHEIREPWERFDVDVERVIDAGDCVVAFLREIGRAPWRSRSAERDRDDLQGPRQKVVEMRGYLDRDEALEGR